MYYIDIIESTIDSYTKYMILGSDGIFEVIDNNLASSIVLPYYTNNKLELSASVLVEKAVLQWRKETDGQDDITSIIVFFDLN